MPTYWPKASKRPSSASSPAATAAISRTIPRAEKAEMFGVLRNSPPAGSTSRASSSPSPVSVEGDGPLLWGLSGIRFLNGPCLSPSGKVRIHSASEVGAALWSRRSPPSAPVSQASCSSGVEGNTSCGTPFCLSTNSLSHFHFACCRRGYTRSFNHATKLWQRTSFAIGTTLAGERSLEEVGVPELCFSHVEQENLPKLSQPIPGRCLHVEAKRKIGRAH